MSNLLKMPLNKVWKEARDQRAALYNNPAWYSDKFWVRNAIQDEWERLTHIIRHEENKAGVNARKRYQLI